MKKNPFSILLCSIFWSFLVSVSCLLVLTYFVYQFEVQNQIVDLTIILIYIFSNIMSGMLIGANIKFYSIIYCVLSSVIYVLIIQLFSVILANGQIETIGIAQITTIVLCLCGNLIGDFMVKRGERDRKLVN